MTENLKIRVSYSSSGRYVALTLQDCTEIRLSQGDATSLGLQLLKCSGYLLGEVTAIIRRAT